MSLGARSRRRSLPGPVAPVFDVHEAFRHGFAKKDAQDALDAAPPGTPEAEAAARALAELVVRRLVRWPGEGDEALLEVVRAGDEHTLRAVIRAVDEYNRKVAGL